MKRIRAAALAMLIGVTVFGAGPALAANKSRSGQGQGAAEIQTPALLNQKIVVDDRLVLLGDIFAELDEKLAATPVLRAPAPGERVILDTNWLARISLRYRVPWKPATRFDRAIVTRKSLRIGRDAIKAALLQAFKERATPAQLRGEVGIELDDSRASFQLPTTAEPSVAVDEFRYDANNGRFSATVRAPAGDPDGPVKKLSGTVAAITRIPVLARKIRHGDVIGEGDVEWIPMRSDRVQRNTVTDERELIGMTARRGINAGQMIRVGELQAPTVIAKGDIITMQLMTGAMRLTAQGRAVENGAMGETIRIMNPRTNKVVYGVVRNPSLVVVQSGAQLSQR